MQNHPNVETLVRLAREDLAISHAKKKIVASKREAVEAENAVVRADEHLIHLNDTLMKLKGEEQRLQQELESYEKRRETARRVLETGNGNPDAADRQIKQCTSIIGDLESKLLVNFDAYETTEANIRSKTEETNTLKQTTQALLASLSDTVAQCEQVVQEKGISRTHISNELAPFLVKRYEQLRRSKGTSVARVVDGCCRTCRLALPMQDHSDLQRGREITCKKCGRWLFIADE